MKTFIEMAGEAGIAIDLLYSEDTKHYRLAGFEHAFENLIEIVRADEREACAKVVEGIVALNEYAYADECVSAIRARGNT